MKKSSTFCILFLMFGFSCALWAQDSLPKIIIGDIHVYESADSIVGEGIQGNVSYDASTNTLFLNDAVIPSLSNIFIHKSSNGFLEFGNTSLAHASVGTALDCARTDYLALTEGATLEITASDYGIFTFYDDIWDSIAHYPNLVVDNSSLIVTAPYCCQFIWFWWLSECHVVAPQDFEYQLDSWTYLSSGTIHDYLEIRPSTVGLPAHETVDWRAWGVDGGIRIDDL